MGIPDILLLGHSPSNKVTLKAKPKLCCGTAKETTQGKVFSGNGKKSTAHTHNWGVN